MPSPFPSMAPIGKPTRQFAGWMRWIQSAKAFARRPPTASHPVYESRCSGQTFRQLRSFVTVAKQLGARQVSFLAVDVANPHAFGRTDDFSSNLALLPEELPMFDELLGDLERECAADFRSGFIAESPAKLRRMLQYFGALRGKAPYPEVRCNAPEFSAVIGAAGRVQPCFFISGPAEARVPGDGVPVGDLSGALNGERMRALRNSIHEGARAECRTCVCSMWRDPQTFGAQALPWL